MGIIRCLICLIFPNRIHNQERRQAGVMLAILQFHDYESDNNDYNNKITFKPNHNKIHKLAVDPITEEFLVFEL